MAESYLQQLVIQRCRDLGDDGAAEFFSVSPALVRQWVNGSKSPSLAAVEKVFVLPDVPPAEAGWNDREVFIAMPFYKTTSPRTLFSLLGVWDRTKFRAGMEFDNAILVDARERLADTFLKSGAQWVWWIDDDLVVPCGQAAWFNRYAEMQLPESFAGLHTPTRLRSHGKSFVSGVYFERRKNGRACYHEALVRTPEGNSENRKAHAGPVDEVRPATWAGLGCAMHTRQVLVDIQSKFPHLAPESPDEVFHFFSNSSDALQTAMPELKAKVASAAEQVKGGSGDAALRILGDVVKQIDAAALEVKKSSRLRQGEDQTFGRRALAAGHQTWIDHAVHCSHLGQFAFNAQTTTS